MTRRPKTGWDVLQYEIAGEQAATIGRLSQALQDSLAALRSTSKEDPKRPELVDAAAYALWNFVVQRDCAGLRFTEKFLRDYGVPQEVRARMGVARAPKTPG